MSCSLLVYSGLGLKPMMAAPATHLSQVVGDPPSVYSAANVQQFLAACQKDQGGCVDEVGTALMDKMQYAGGSDVCLTQVNYGNAVPKWLSAHSETAAMPTEDGIYTALKAIYPC